MYVFYKEWFWMSGSASELPSGEPTQPQSSRDYVPAATNEPQLITNWLTFLPDEFREISAIYQRPSGEVVMFVDDEFYMINFPSLSLVSGYPKHISELGIGRGNTINAVVNTYTGKTFLFYNNNYYTEIDECLMKAKNYGLISKLFPGLPPSINSYR